MKIMIINGPNINFTGIREKELYGSKNYKEIELSINNYCKEKEHEVKIFQSNIEGEIINCIQEAYSENYEGIVINPGAYTHYSYAIYDALKSVDIKTVEVHMTNIHKREEFRHKSVTAKACIGQISGFGEYGYIMAINALENVNKF